MAYDENLAARIRDLLEGDADVREKAMFGGLAFLVGGNMAVAAGSGGAMMVRCAAEDTDRLASEGARPMVMRGREMRGWLEVSAQTVADDESLRRWVDVGVRHARTLSPK